MKQPNILIVMPDQWRGDCLSLENHPVLMTPNIDQIGAKGTHFTRAYTTCPSCIPARRAMLTGQFPETNGMVGFKGGDPLRSETFPQHLSDNGYSTVLVGRTMHQDPPEEPYGFEKWIAGSTYVTDDEYAQMLDEEVPALGGIRGIGVAYNGWQSKPWPLDEHLHPTNWVVKKSRDEVRSHSNDRPLCLVTSFYAPHPPLIPPAFYMERYLRQQLPEPSIGDWAEAPANDGVGAGVESARVHLRGEAQRSALAGYYGMINHIDDQLTWFLSEFKSKSAAAGRPWVIVFTSDHGEMLGDHYYFRKCEPYEGSARIPFLIQASSELGFSSGVKCSRPVCLEDLFPTLMEAAGIAVPENLDGQSLIPILRGEDAEHRPWLHSEHSTCYSKEQAFHALTDGRMKYIWRTEHGNEQLFDINEDPNELTDLSSSADHQEELQTWRNVLIERLKERPEGFVENGALVAGREYPAVLKS